MAKREPKTNRVHMRITPAFNDVLVKYSKGERRSMTTFIENAVAYYIERNYRSSAGKQLRSRGDVKRTEPQGRG
jgi:hypothetical protein